MESTGTWTLWAVFTVLVVAALAIDLGLFRRKVHEISLKEATGWSIFWVLLSCGFGLGVWWSLGWRPAAEFFGCYINEKALSVDNLFVFAVIFAAMGVPKQLQHRVLFWGIVAAAVLRGVFIGLGAVIVHHFHGVLYIFGAFLVYTAWKLIFSGDEEPNPKENRVFRLFKRVVPSVDEYHGTAFWVREKGRWLATPMLAVLVLIEVSDLLFAVDSIPAAFGFSTDAFVLYTSNIFAILGLRSMYFMLSFFLGKFSYLKQGLAAVLAFIGVKLLISEWLWTVPIEFTLPTIALMLGVAVAASLLFPKAEDGQHKDDAAKPVSPPAAPPKAEDEAAKKAVVGGP